MASLKHTEYDNMFTTTDVKKHDDIKAKLLGPYSGRELEGMEPTYVCVIKSSSLSSWLSLPAGGVPME